MGYMLSMIFVMGMILSGLVMILGPIGLSIKGYKKIGIGTGVAGLIGIFVFAFLCSFRYVPTGQIAVVEKTAFGSELGGGDIIATDGEMGMQAQILRNGWHSGLWPFIYELHYEDIYEVPRGQLGIVRTIDGKPLPRNQVFAPEWTDVQQFLDARYFLTSDQGFKGAQTTVLREGQYAFNPELYQIETVDATIIGPSEVGVVKSNVGDLYSDSGLAQSAENNIVPKGYRGIWETTYAPGIVPLNPRAYEIIPVDTTVQIVDYTSKDDNDDEFTQKGLESQIQVKTRDGFIFPVDVRVEYRVSREDAPSIVSNFYSKRDRTYGRQMRQKINSTVRSVFRNNAEQANALDYINQRSTQESRCLEMIREELGKFGITVLRVAIGDIDPDNESAELAALLKTQTDKQIAEQQQRTFQIQQAAAREEQKLNDERKRAEEIRRLATADFDSQVADKEAERIQKIAAAEAEAVRIQRRAEADGVLAIAQAEAEGYRQKAEAIGPENLAMIELFDRIASGEIKITPEILVGGADGGGGIGSAIATMFLQRLQAGEALIELDSSQE